MRTELRKAILNSVDKSELEILIFSNTDINLELSWKNDFQFEFNGQSYELAHKEVRPKTNILWCKKETNGKTFKEELREVLILNMAGANDHKEHQLHLFHWFKSLKPETGVEVPCFAEAIIKGPIYNYTDPFYTAPGIQPHIPPPDFITLKV